MLSRFAEPLVNIDQFLKKWSVTNSIFKSDAATIVGDWQTFSTWRSKMGLAAGRRNEEETDL